MFAGCEMFVEKLSKFKRSIVVANWIRGEPPPPFKRIRKFTLSFVNRFFQSSVGVGGGGGGGGDDDDDDDDDDGADDELLEISLDVTVHGWKSNETKIKQQIENCKLEIVNKWMVFWAR